MSEIYSWIDESAESGRAVDYQAHLSEVWKYKSGLDAANINYANARAALDNEATAHRMDNAMFRAELAKAAECIAHAIAMREARIRGDMAECMNRDTENAVAHDGILLGWRAVLADIGGKR